MKRRRLEAALHAEAIRRVAISAASARLTAGFSRQLKLVMRVVAVHRGSRDSYQVAWALREAGLLETLVTDMYWPADHILGQAIERIAPKRLSDALRCRYAPGLPSGSVTSCWMTGLGSFAASKTGRLPFNWERKAIRCCDRRLGRRAGQIATGKRAALLSYSYYAYDALSEYEGDQPRILFQLHPHPAGVRAILRRERALHPDCAASLDKEWELALPERDFQRLSEEAAMAGHWIAASSFTRRTLTDAGIPADRITVIPYGIDLSRFSPPNGGRTSRRPLRLLFVGTLGQRKGIKYLIQALDLLPRGSVELTVCGRAVDDLAIFRNIDAPVHICPSIGAQGLLDAYRAADVFVFPSLAEGFGHVLLEAMATGLPVISTTRTAALDLIRNGREGLIIQPGSASELAQSIEEFLRRPEKIRRMGEAARQRAEYFTWPRFRQRIAEFVGGVLGRPAGSRDMQTCL